MLVEFTQQSESTKSRREFGGFSKNFLQTRFYDENKSVTSQNLLLKIVWRAFNTGTKHRDDDERKHV